MVFIPGASFSAAEVSKLDSYIATGDLVIVQVRAQAERSGCRWIAEYATKISSHSFSEMYRSDAAFDLASEENKLTFDKGYFRKGYFAFFCQISTFLFRCFWFLFFQDIFPGVMVFIFQDMGKSLA